MSLIFSHDYQGPPLQAAGILHHAPIWRCYARYHSNTEYRKVQTVLRLTIGSVANAALHSKTPIQIYDDQSFAFTPAVIMIAYKSSKKAREQGQSAVLTIDLRCRVSYRFQIRTRTTLQLGTVRTVDHCREARSRQDRTYSHYVRYNPKEVSSIDIAPW